MRVLAVGDIHTKIWIIEAVQKLLDNYDQVVFVGDYADDWNSSSLKTIETWKALRKFQRDNPKKVKLVVGNHDYIYVHKTPTLASGYSQITQTLIDAPENKRLKSWLRSLPVIQVIDEVRYSHAGITEFWDGEDTVESLWDDASPLWARPTGISVYKPIVQVFGHTPSETCWEVQNGPTCSVWCIDTFSTYSDGMPVGDGTVLEIINGTIFNKIKL